MSLNISRNSRTKTAGDILNNSELSQSSTGQLNVNSSSRDELNDTTKEPANNAEGYKKTKKKSSQDQKMHHNIVEKQRRNMLTTQINELSRLLSLDHNASSQKMDKTKVLDMVVEKVKLIQSTYMSYADYEPYKHVFVEDQNFKKLITCASSDSFVLVVNCLRGEILYASNTVTQILNYLPANIVGSNVFDYIHPTDVAKVKEQLSGSNFDPVCRYVDGETKLEVFDVMKGSYCTGARRSFVCQIKCKDNDAKINDLATTTKSNKVIESGKRYIVTQCTGYLKYWSQENKFDDSLVEVSKQVEVKDDNIGVNNDHTENNICLVAVWRIINTKCISNQPETVGAPPCFTSKHTIEGKFIFVDQNVTHLVGFLPQELLGTSIYQYIHFDDYWRLSDLHKATLEECKPQDTEIYKFLIKDKNKYVYLRSEWKSFRNPWTKQIDFVVAKNFLISLNSNRNNGNISAVCSSLSQLKDRCLTVTKETYNDKKMQNSHLENVSFFTEPSCSSIEIQKPSSSSLSYAALACRPSTSSGSGIDSFKNGVGDGMSSNGSNSHVSYAPAYADNRQYPQFSSYSNPRDALPLPPFVHPNSGLLPIVVSDSSDEIFRNVVLGPSPMSPLQYSVIFESEAEDKAVTDIIMNLLETDPAGIISEIVHFPRFQ